MPQVPMTVIGKKKLEDEIKQLKTVERPKVIEQIAVARSHGDEGHRSAVPGQTVCATRSLIVGLAGYSNESERHSVRAILEGG